MKHLDEHTIELYILGSDLVKEQTGEIEAHLKECHGCRSLAERMKVFYEKAENELEASERLSSEPGKAIVKRQAELDFTSETFTFPVRPSGNKYMARFLYFVYRHPIPAAIGGFISVAAVATAMLFGIKDFIKDANPAYPHLNVSSATIEIYNKDNQLLWNIPSKSIFQISEQEYANKISNIRIVDLDGDNMNEVITALQVGKNVGDLFPLTYFSSQGEIIKEVLFREQVYFNGSKYSDNFNARNLICENINGEQEIFTIVDNLRSPNIVYRLSSKGVILGQYFHFGHGNISSIHIAGRKVITFFGQNDVGDPDSLSYAVICILDPLKITEKKQASDSRGFGLPISLAELFIIRLPLSDMNYLWGTPCHSYCLNETFTNGIKTFNIGTKGFYNTAQDPKFEYVFSDDLKILEVKYDNTTLRIRNQFIAQNKLKGTFDKLYLENLKNGVRYWNGREWQKVWTRVEHQ